MKLESTRGTVVVPALLQGFYDETQVPGAILNGSTLWVTGQTGIMEDGSIAPTPQEQIRQSFRVVGECLSAAGAAWSDVVAVTAYTIGLRQHGEEMVEIAGEFLSAPLPAWTAVGVTELWEEGAMFELSCVAVVRQNE
jgi:enamine deaminase RidA (YjgF/YER057c/UK114 family)